jgi:hypothetical protein
MDYAVSSKLVSVQNLLAVVLPLVFLGSLAQYVKAPVYVWIGVFFLALAGYGLTGKARQRLVVRGEALVLERYRLVLGWKVSEQIPVVEVHVVDVASKGLSNVLVVNGVSGKVSIPMGVFGVEEVRNLLFELSRRNGQISYSAEATSLLS